MEEEREEERERQELKRRNYQLVVERAGLRRRGSNDSVEDQVGFFFQIWQIYTCFLLMTEL